MTNDERATGLILNTPGFYLFIISVKIKHSKENLTISASCFVQEMRSLCSGEVNMASLKVNFGQTLMGWYSLPMVGFGENSRGGQRDTTGRGCF